MPFVEPLPEVTIKPPISAHVAATLSFLCVPLALWVGASGLNGSLDVRCCFVGRPTAPQGGRGTPVHGGAIVLLTVLSCLFVIVLGLQLLGPRMVVGATEVRLRSRWWRVRTIARDEVTAVRLEPRVYRFSLLDRKRLAPALVLAQRVERLGFLETSDDFAAEFRLRDVERAIFPSATHA
ncbi:MAG: hypothetical protein RLZZ623_1007 [Actinomycetota bacterium]